ncbi:MAG: hypothetical protein JXQ84_07805 [Rhodospirillaceae bacterium]|nr:hypothetical protein [Rhodospirillaceae bacterium]
MDPISAAIGLASYAAPHLAKWIFGDEGATVAQKVVDAAQTLTGTTTPADAEAALRANPELLLRYKQQLAALNADLERAYLADRQSARDRDKAIVQAGQRNIRADLMVIGATLGLVVCVVVLVAWRTAIPGEVVGILSTVCGIFGSCLKDAFAFEFGSSRGSKEKDMLMAQISGGGRA